MENQKDLDGGRVSRNLVSRSFKTDFILDSLVSRVHQELIT